MTSDHEDHPVRPEGVTLEDVRAQLAGRWECRAITAGYVGIPKLSDGTPIPRYGQTPAELLDNILRSEQSQ
ncbi:MAG TPA: hypothetical protein VN847_04980 [Streptosporangiaceae bacterium]|nr:hypothetical protein [Streptosporangiaceae bacterium]